MVLIYSGHYLSATSSAPVTISSNDPQPSATQIGGSRGDSWRRGSTGEVVVDLDQWFTISDDDPQLCGALLRLLLRQPSPSITLLYLELSISPHPPPISLFDEHTATIRNSDRDGLRCVWLCIKRERERKKIKKFTVLTLPLVF